MRLLVNIGDMIGATPLKVESLRDNGKYVACTCTKCGARPSDTLYSLVFRNTKTELSNVKSCPYCDFIERLKAERTAKVEKALSEGKNVPRNIMNIQNSIDLRNAWLSAKNYDILAKTMTIIQKGVVIADTDLESFEDTPFIPGKKYKAPTKDYVDYEFLGSLLLVKSNSRVGNLDIDDPDTGVIRCSSCGAYHKIELNRDTVFSCKYCLKEKQTLADTKIKETSNKKLMLSKSALARQNKINSNSATANYLVEFNKLNPDFFVASYGIKNGNFMITSACKVCGTLKVVNASNKEILDCTFCKSDKKKDTYKVGELKQNYIGLVKNNMVVIRQNVDNFTVDIKCLNKNCDRVDTVGLYSFLNYEYYCPCLEDNFIYDFTCPECGLPVNDNANNKAIQHGGTRDAFCLYCKNDNNTPLKITTALKAQRNSQDDLRSLYQKIKMAEEGLNLGVNSKTSLVLRGVLLTEREAFYWGVGDKIPYYRCFCTKCNSELLLSEAEIETYKHHLCNDARSRLTPKPNPDKLEF